jgi:Transposase/WD domain, G-beta repeat
LSLALPDATFVAGIDWAAAEHAVCVMDESGKVVASFTICHDADGLRRLTRRLAAFGEPGSIPVGIERPSGRLVDVLLEAGHPVVPVKPNAIKAWRESEVLSGAKSDAADGHTDRVEAMAISPDGTWLATGSTDETARIWAADGTLRATLRPVTQSDRTVAKRNSKKSRKALDTKTSCH